MNKNTGTQKTSQMNRQEAFGRTRDYFLGESLRLAENIPNLLTENRKIALSLVEGVMEVVGIIASYFGIPTMDLVVNALPEVSLELEADGIREQAAARTYLDLKGAVPLADICRGAYAYPVPTLHCVAKEIQRRARFAKYSSHDPLLKRIFCNFDNNEGNTAEICEEIPRETGNSEDSEEPNLEDPLIWKFPSDT